jgi:hypothetical protein
MAQTLQPAAPPPPPQYQAFGLIYEGAISQQRQTKSLLSLFFLALAHNSSGKEQE